MIDGAIESVSKRKTVWKVALFILASLGRPLFEMSVNLAEGLIEEACQHEGLLAKQFANN